MLIDERTYCEQVLPVSNSRQLKSLLRSNFKYEMIPDYLEYLTDHISYERRNDPNYLTFFSRVSIMAAVYGFPESSGHVLRYSSTDLEFTHPLCVLETANYLSNIIIQVDKQRKETIENIKANSQLDEDIEQKILGSWVVPFRNKVNYPSIKSIDDLGCLYFTRSKKNLPVYQPDLEFHHKVAQINISREKIVRLTRQEFQTGILPVVQNVFGNLFDVEAVFQDIN